MRLEQEPTTRPESAPKGSDAQNPGPGRDTRRTDPAATADAEDPQTTTAMSDTDPARTRLGRHEPGPARH